MARSANSAGEIPILNRIHIIGRKNAGKTTLLAEILSELTARGFSVGSIKHTRHDYELDSRGKDSYRHRIAGAAPASVISGELTAVYIPARHGEAMYAALEPLYADCDMTLVEGDRDTKSLKIEVWRRAVQERPLAEQRDDIALLISDDPVGVSAPTVPRSDLSAICDEVIRLSGIPMRRSGRVQFEMAGS